MSAWLGRIGFVLIIGGLFWVISPSGPALHGQAAFSQNAPTGQVGEASLHVHSTLLPSGIEQLTVIDQRARSLAIYHVEPTSGKVQLKSVRNLVWDLQMEHFNGQAPLPSELRQVQP